MFKKGDKVFSILKGWGEVITDPQIEHDYSFKAKFANELIGYYFGDGTTHKNDINPELYHAEPTITVPKRRVEHKGWIGIENADAGNLGRNTTCIYGNKDEILPIVDDWNKGATIQEITFYTEE